MELDDGKWGYLESEESKAVFVDYHDGCVCVDVEKGGIGVVLFNDFEVWEGEPDDLPFGAVEEGVGVIDFVDEVHISLNGIIDF